MPLIVSQAGTDLVVAEETGGRAYYEKRCLNFEWPGGSSGPTVAGGYDCGYVTQAECRADWDGILEPAQIEVLVEAVGRKGTAARDWVAANKRRVTVTWEQALSQYTTREQPKWLARLDAALPNCFELAPDCIGALHSLTFNRGCSFDLDGDRFREMRAIKAAMRDRRFEDIPAQLRSMARLWTGGLRERRLHEAALFEKGLAAMRAASCGTHASGMTPEPGAIFAPVAVPSDRAEPVDEPPPPPPPVTQSKSVRASIANALAGLLALLSALGAAVDKLLGQLPDIQTDVETQLSAVKSLAALIGNGLGLAVSPPVFATLTIVLSAYTIYRRTLPRGA